MRGGACRGAASLSSQKLLVLVRCTCRAGSVESIFFLARNVARWNLSHKTWLIFSPVFWKPPPGRGGAGMDLSILGLIDGLGFVSWRETDSDDARERAGAARITSIRRANLQCFFANFDWHGQRVLPWDGTCKYI